MIFHPAADFQRMSVNRPEVSPPAATVLFNSYLLVARTTSAASVRISISLKANKPPPGLSIRIASAVAFENRLGAASRDFAADKGGLGRVFIIRGKRSQIASIPCRLRILEQGANFVGLRE